MEEMMKDVLRMLRARCDYYAKAGNTEKAISYDSAATMVEYALEGNVECLRQMDYFE